MKSVRILPIRFCLICLFALCFLSCGGTEDVETGTINTLNPSDTLDKTTEDREELDGLVSRVETLYTQFTIEKPSIPRNWEQTEDLALRAAYARFLLAEGKIALPPHWIHTEDPVLRAEYYRAQLSEQFGQTHEVRIVASWRLKYAIAVAIELPWFSPTSAEYIAYLEAMYHLWPNETNRQTLEGAREITDTLTYEELKAQHPEVWSHLERAYLIAEHGDKPETHIMADYHRKVALELPITEAETLSYLEAVVHLNPEDEVGPRLLARYRQAKAAGIPFADVETDDLVPSKEADDA